MAEAGAPAVQGGALLGSAFVMQEAYTNLGVPMGNVGPTAVALAPAPAATSVESVQPMQASVSSQAGATVVPHAVACGLAGGATASGGSVVLPSTTPRGSVAASRHEASIAAMGTAIVEASLGARRLALSIGTICSGTDFIRKFLEDVAAWLSNNSALEIIFTFVFACEIDPKARAAIIETHDTGFVFDDARGLAQGGPVWDHRSCRWVAVPRVDLLVAGFACTQYSAMNNFRASQRDAITSNAGASGETWAALRDYTFSARVSMVLLENTREIGTASRQVASGIQQIEEQLSPQGYSCDALLLNSSSYGSPQDRVRMYIICVRQPLIPQHDSEQLRLLLNKLRLPHESVKSVLMSKSELMQDPFYTVARLADGTQQLEATKETDKAMRAYSQAGFRFPPSVWNEDEQCVKQSPVTWGLPRGSFVELSGMSKRACFLSYWKLNAELLPMVNLNADGAVYFGNTERSFDFCRLGSGLRANICPVITPKCQIAILDSCAHEWRWLSVVEAWRMQGCELGEMMSVSACLAESNRTIMHWAGNAFHMPTATMFVFASIFSSSIFASREHA